MAMLLAAVVAGAAAVLLLDGVFALLGLGDFGRVNGWLAAILPVMLLVEEFRAWRGVRARIVVALVAAAARAWPSGLVVAGLVGDLPALVSGALGAVAFTAGLRPAVVLRHPGRRRPDR